LPGLAVPTRILVEDGTRLPPVDHRLDEAEHSVAIVLADNKMVVEEDIPAGRVAWPDFVADIAEKCADGRHRFLPVQLSESAWPLHEKLGSINFIRAFAKEPAERPAWVERMIVVEICRFLLGKERGTTVPITVFLSHAKQDIEKSPNLFKDLVAHLLATQPVAAWVDSGQIEPGKDFAVAIEKGVRDAAVLVLLTSSYSGRTWCRREVLFAKKHGRPLVVVDGLDGIDIRAFPYIGNVPMLSWSHGGAQRAIDLLLKEQLRHLHVRRVLERSRKADDCVLTAPPELTTLVSVPKGSNVLYPDPPLGDEEVEIFGSPDRRIETPLQRLAADRTLTGQKVALSISESDAPERAGTFPEHLNAALLEISRYLLVKGATLAYGGHLGSEGYTAALFDLVRAHRQPSGLPAVDRIVNYVGWPSPLSDEQRAKFRELAKFERIGAPAGIAALEPQTFVPEPSYFPADSPVRRFAWARGMTRMRERQTADIRARIAIGGKVGPTVTAQADGGKKVAWYSGRIPGVIEEIILTLQAGKPLYLCGAFGGAAALAIELLEGRVPQEFTWNYQKQAPHAEAMRELYAQHGIEWLDYPQMAKTFADVGVAGLSRANHLSDDENRELFRCRDVPRVVELLLLGLTRA
jgi:SLOG cluster2/TIR domain